MRKFKDGIALHDSKMQFNQHVAYDLPIYVSETEEIEFPVRALSSKQSPS